MGGSMTPRTKPAAGSITAHQTPIRRNRKTGEAKLAGISAAC
jgi:hypothetical protein